MITLIKNGTIVNEGLSYKGSLLINDKTISKIIAENDFDSTEQYKEATDALLYGIPTDEYRVVDATGLHILPGVIDDQVHFREPGNTAKATVESESKAAVLGGVTSFMDMPNNNPPTVTLEALEAKYSNAAANSYANYSFYLGATNDNLQEIKKIDKKSVCGVKVFMGSSTGNMLVNSQETLESIFRESPVLIATHCEDEQTIKENTQKFIEKYGDDIPFEMHPQIRSREACTKCSSRALELAVKNSSRLHILHLSTADEIEMIKEAKKHNPDISGEVCVHYMWFNNKEYPQYGSKMKCNPAIKEESDMRALRKAVKEGAIDVVATDHAPHLLEEKQQPYTKAPSGLPLVQHSLQLMLELVKKGVFTIEEVAQKMSHGPAKCFNINKRGYIKEGFYADLVLIDTSCPDSSTASSPAYKCGWSPFGGYTFSSTIVHTFVNGCQVVSDSKLTGEKRSMRLMFDRD
ncbi:MAG: dihydroorotase [Bacteroidales bacterium]|nr:dihydroorotase [Bacteroidales bacterium]